MAVRARIQLTILARSTPISIDLQQGTLMVSGAVANIENLIGSRQSDQLTGDAAANSIIAGEGNDSVSGGGRCRLY